MAKALGPMARRIEGVEALHAAGRKSLTISIPEVTPFQLGLLIALFERAVSFYASLVNINAYHQPGVEAGKKFIHDWNIKPPQSCSGCHR